MRNLRSILYCCIALAGDVLASGGASSTVAWDAPEGVLKPALAHVQSITWGDSTTSYRWKATMKVDTSHPMVKAIIKKWQDFNPHVDAADAYLQLYIEELKAKGIEASEHMDGIASYLIDEKSEEPLQVLIRTDDDFHGGDPTGFTIFVSPPGG